MLGIVGITSYDPGHLKAIAYPKIAQFISDELSKVIPPANKFGKKIIGKNYQITRQDHPPARNSRARDDLRRQIIRCEHIIETQSKEIEAKDRLIQSLREVIKMHKNVYAQTLKELIQKTNFRQAS